jgi:hypothetical protein
VVGRFGAGGVGRFGGHASARRRFGSLHCNRCLEALGEACVDVVVGAMESYLELGLTSRVH